MHRLKICKCSICKNFVPLKISLVKNLSVRQQLVQLETCSNFEKEFSLICQLRFKGEHADWKSCIILRSGSNSSQLKVLEIVFLIWLLDKILLISCLINQKSKILNLRCIKRGFGPSTQKLILNLLQIWLAITHRQDETFFY